MKNKWVLFSFLCALSAPLQPLYAATQSEPNVNTDPVEQLVVTVNINSASAEELATLLLGVGAQKAQAIVDFRETNGPFSAKEEITKVKGIGPSILDKNITRITL
jgi:competence protein ComEA